MQELSLIFRQVLTLVSGTVLSQLFIVVSIPILTRIYEPSSFGLVSLFMSCVAFLTIISTARYEFAITLPKKDIDSANLVKFTVKLAIVISLISFIVLLLSAETISELLGSKDIKNWLYLLPLVVVGTSIFNVLQYWCNRKSDYKYMSINRITNTGSTTLANIIFGMSFKINGGLIIGECVGRFISAFFILKRVRLKYKKYFKNFDFREELIVAKEYLRHPLYIMPAQLCSVSYTIMPAIVISKFYGIKMAGYYYLANRVINFPVVLVANAIGDVYRQNISSMYNNYKTHDRIYLSTLLKSFYIGLPSCLCIYLLSPILFTFLFGEEWAVAGSISQILSIVCLFQFVFTPIDKGSLVVGATRYNFCWHLFRLLSLVCLAIFVSYKKIEIYNMLWIYVSINILYYSIDGIMNYNFSKLIKTN